MATCLSTMSLLFVVLIGFLCVSNARNHTFYVGGKDGWTMKPSESYNQWAERYRFVVNDELVFKYKSGHDSVLVVNENDYYKCNKDNPIKSVKAKDGESRFILDRSGPFFFISGHNQNCEDGQKLILVVPSSHHHAPAKTSAHAPSPSAETLVDPPSPSPEEQPYFDRSPSPSPAAAHAPLHDIEQHSSPAKTPADAPLVEPPSQSPLHENEAESDQSPTPASSPHKKAGQVRADHIALPPDENAPAPAPSSGASALAGSFALVVGLGVVATALI